MALVAYDNSDSSDYEDDENESKTLLEKKEADLPVDPVLQNVDPLKNGEQDSDENKSLFIQLPQPSSKKITVLEEDDEFLHKKESLSDAKPKSRITIPSLNDFKDVDVTVPSSKTKAINGKKSGLLSILPQPKGATISTRSLIPNVVAQKPQTTTAKKKTTLPSPIITKNNIKGLITEYSDESDSEEVKNDFFSINKPINLPIEEDLPLNIEETIQNVKKQPRSIESYFKKEDHMELQPDVESIQTVEPSGMQDYNNAQSSESTDNTGESSNNEVVLDEEAILKLCGARGKRKREEIQIVDINQQEVLSEAREWLLKGLMEDTSKRQSASKKRGHEPTSQQRRKHQITYLAHQAKANEAELQNQWANNRMTKRQTQSKYGF